MTLNGVWVPVVTPFQQNQVDTTALANLARHLAQQGVQGFIAGATTGEGCSLNLGEVGTVFNTLRTTLGADYPIYLGVSGSHTEEVRQQVQQLAALHPDGLLISAPSYVRPSQDGLYRHFMTLADACPLPILIYNIPYRTGVNVELATFQALAQHPHIVGVKECGGNLQQLQDLINETPLAVFCGEDALALTALCLGAKGMIAAAAHIFPELYVRLYQQVAAGHLPQARAINRALQPLIRALFTEPNPAPVKAALAEAGWLHDELRLPLLPASASCRQLIQAARQQVQRQNAAFTD